MQKKKAFFLNSSFSFCFPESWEDESREKRSIQRNFHFLIINSKIKIWHCSVLFSLCSVIFTASCWRVVGTKVEMKKNSKPNKSVLSDAISHQYHSDDWFLILAHRHKWLLCYSKLFLLRLKKLRINRSCSIIYEIFKANIS